MSLKSPAELVKRLENAYARRWAREACRDAAGGAASTAEQAWPLSVALGSPTAAQLQHDFAAVCAQCDELEALAAKLGLEVLSESRRVGVSTQRIPTHVVARDIDALARAVGKAAHLARARERATRIAREFVSAGPVGGDAGARTSSLLAACDRYVPEDVDFDLACRAATWFSSHESSDMTARQVPLEGFHAKWLDREGRRQVVAALAGLERLELRERPAIVRFTYLDPAHLAAGGRRHDSHVAGDCDLPAYAPRTVIIVENRDSALWFPQLEGGIAVMGDGGAGIASVAGIPWVRQARQLVYWGDMDAAGLEILSGYRASGLPVRSILMDMPAYERYERFGTSVDKNGHALAPKQPLADPRLQPHELELYLHLVDPAWTRARRIEQERIPLQEALAEVLRME